MIQRVIVAKVIGKKVADLLALRTVTRPNYCSQVNLIYETVLK